MQSPRWKFIQACSVLWRVLFYELINIHSWGVNLLSNGTIWKRKERKWNCLLIIFQQTNMLNQTFDVFFLGLWLLTHGELGRRTWCWHCTHSLAELANACTISIDRFSIKGEGGRVSLMSGSWHTALGGFCISKTLIYSDSLALCFPCLLHLSYVVLQVWGHVHIYVCLSW